MSTTKIEYDKDYGFYITNSWVPSPRFALRRRRILALAQTMPAGKLLETGPGAGALLRAFAVRGFDCVGYDTSTAAREVTNKMIHDLDNAVTVTEMSDEWVSRFDYLISCEVLEHIEDDQAALNEWVNYLKPDGEVIIAVPCHMKKFSALDKWAGHYRRYDKPELLALLEKSGLEVCHFETYGFPMANISSAINLFIKKNKKQSSNMEDNTAQSGIERGPENKLFKLQTVFLGRIAMRIGFALQFLFKYTEWGDGFIVVARKKRLHE